MDYTPINIKTNLQALTFLIKHQIFFANIITAVNNAGAYIPNNKLFFYTFYDPVTKQRYTLSAYEILYSKRQMFLYNTPEKFYNDSIVKQYIQAYMGKYETLKKNNYVYMAFYAYYTMALYYSSVLSYIFNSITYKNTAKYGDLVFEAYPRFFPHIENDQIKKKYTNEATYLIYKSLNNYYE